MAKLTEEIVYFPIIIIGKTIHFNKKDETSRRLLKTDL